jgi:hypothetical protein
MSGASAFCSGRALPGWLGAARQRHLGRRRDGLGTGHPAALCPVAGRPEVALIDGLEAIPVEHLGNWPPTCGDCAQSLSTIRN